MPKEVCDVNAQLGAYGLYVLNIYSLFLILHYKYRKVFLNYKIFFNIFLNY